MSRWAARGVLLGVALLLAAALQPFGPRPLPNLGAALAFALAALAAERVVGAADAWAMAGAALGVLVGGLVGLVLARLLPETAQLPSAPALRPFVSLVALYAGGVGGARFGRALRAELSAGGALGPEAPRGPGHKVVDTSAIIDGRIADLAAGGFLEGVLVVPAFVLRELQFVADSADRERRARGRRGLAILQRLKEDPRAKVVFSSDEIPELRAVDDKLVELARRTGSKLVTTDSNLKGVAELKGVEVLSLHDLGAAMRPAVQAGETLRLSIVREGKEPGQGVAYLEDGTMVVVDGGRDRVGRTVDVVLTSVLQTSAGKMYFGRPAEPVQNG